MFLINNNRGMSGNIMLSKETCLQDFPSSCIPLWIITKITLPIIIICLFHKAPFNDPLGPCGLGNDKLTIFLLSSMSQFPPRGNASLSLNASGIWHCLLLVIWNKPTWWHSSLKISSFINIENVLLQSNHIINSFLQFIEEYQQQLLHLWPSNSIVMHSFKISWSILNLLELRSFGESLSPPFPFFKSLEVFNAFCCFNMVLYGIP